MPRRAGACVVVFAAATCAAVDALPAQTVPCTMAGRVTAPDGAPLPGAVLAARATGEARPDSALASSAADGRYCLRVRGGSEYVLQVDAVGFVSRAMLLALPAGAPTRAVDLQLTPAAGPVQLEAVVARAPARVVQSTPRGAPPGSGLASRSGASAGLFAVAPGDLAASAGVSGQHLPVAGGGLAIDGQGAAGSRTTLDGAGFEARDVPAEGLAAAGVFAHPYDVSRGQFTGGEIAGRTMGGTNVWGGAARLAGSHDQLMLSGGGGGPLRPGTLFVYAAVQANRRQVDPLPLYPRSASSAVSADSLARFYQILERLGVGADPGESGAGSTVAASAIARVDYVPGGAHQLMLRLDGRGLRASGAAGALAAGAGARREESAGGGALVQLTSRLRGMENELSVRGSTAGQRVRVAFAGPAGQVWVGSAAGAEGLSGAQLAFGGEPPGVPAEDRAAVEIGDRLVVELAGGRHQLQAGAAWQGEDVWRASRADRMGTFGFASLPELEAGRPVRFTRALGDRDSRLTSGYAAAYAGDVWKPAPGLRVVVGVRGERHSFGGPASSHPLADSVFGLRPLPARSRWSASPRAGFTWYRSMSTTTLGVLGGTGVFRGAVPTRLLAAMLAGDGGGQAVNLVCVGDGVPTPRWADYLRDRATIPTQCAGGGPGTAAAPAVGVTGFSGDYAPPRVWHSSLGASWLHRESGTGVEVRLGYSRGAAAPLVLDLNLDAASRFRLADEGGRPVFAPATAIDPATGQVSSHASRLDPRFGIVRQAGSRGASSARTLGVVAHRLTGTGLMELYYTYTRSRDQSTGLAGPGGGWATTAADPRRAEWAPADFEQAHAFQLSMVRQLRRWGNATVVWRLMSGTPFTPMVDADVNGDGLANDRAFVFDPGAAADARVRADMAALLDRLPGGARACLQAQTGRIAERNSCRTPWTSFLDLQLNLFPGGPRNKRVAVNFSAENVTSAIDRIVHGAGSLRGWGQYPSADPVLLRAVGFDAGRGAFRYEVNPGFGPDAGRWGRVPFALRVQARVTLGADPATQALVAQVVASQDRVEPADVRARMLRGWGNTPAAVLAHHASHSLGLTPRQVAALRAAADSVRTRSEPIMAELAEGILNLGGSDAAMVRSTLQRQRDLLAQAQAALDGGLAAARASLTPEQWARLPRALRTAPRATLPISPQGGVQLLPDF